MQKSSSLTVEQRLAAVDLFEEGFGHACGHFSRAG